MVTSTEQQTFKFRKGTPESLISEALATIPLLNQFVTASTQSVIELELKHKFLALKSKLGENQFTRLVKAHAPLTAREILQKLSVVELVQRSPHLYERLKEFGAEACATLKNASNDLLARILSETAHYNAATLSVLKTLVRRENKGFAPIPTPEEKRAYAKGTLVEVTKSGQTQGWVAEVLTEPNNFGQLQIRLLKTCRKRTLFLHEVTVHSEVTTPDPEAVMAREDWGAIATSYVFPTKDDFYVALTDNDLQNLKAIALEIARADTDPEDTEIVIRWRHALVSIERYGLVPCVKTVTPPAPDRSCNRDRTASLLEKLASLRKMKATLSEELDACVTQDARDLLRQKLRYVEMAIEKILDTLCAGVESDTSIDLSDFATALKEKDEVIESLHSELDMQRSQSEQTIRSLTHQNQILTQQVAELLERTQDIAQTNGSLKELEESKNRIVELEKSVEDYKSKEIEFTRRIVEGQDILELENFLTVNFDKKLVRDVSIWDALRSAPKEAARAIRVLAERLKYEIDSHVEPDFDEDEWENERSRDYSYF